MPTERCGRASTCGAHRLGVIAGATVVPLVAVQQSRQGTFVYLVKPDNTVAPSR